MKEGQSVNVKFDNFPYMEFGMVRVQITNISLIPIDAGDNKKAYILEVDFPEKLKTNYGKELTFSQEMTGTAEIITEDLRLLDKFLNPLENAALQVIELYFSLLETQTNIELLQQNKFNTDTLLQIAQDRFTFGKVTEDEVLQIEVNLLNLTFQIGELQNEWQDKQANLSYFLNLPANIYTLQIPLIIDISTLSREQAYEKAIAKPPHSTRSVAIRSSINEKSHALSTAPQKPKSCIHRATKKRATIKQPKAILT